MAQQVKVKHQYDNYLNVTYRPANVALSVIVRIRVPPGGEVKEKIRVRVRSRVCLCGTNPCLKNEISIPD